MSVQLDRLLFLQASKCFFCQQPLAKEDASVEHLVAVVNGGGNSDDNCVACCKTVNHYLGSLPLKEKIRVILSHQGKVACPRKTAQVVKQEQAVKANDDEMLIQVYLSRLETLKPNSRPNKISSLRKDVMAKCKISEDKATKIIETLSKKRVITINDSKVSYGS